MNYNQWKPHDWNPYTKENCPLLPMWPGKALFGKNMHDLLQIPSRLTQYSSDPTTKTLMIIIILILMLSCKVLNRDIKIIQNQIKVRWNTPIISNRTMCFKLHKSCVSFTLNERLQLNWELAQCWICTFTQVKDLTLQSKTCINQCYLHCIYHV